MQQQANLEHESITTDQLVELNREFQNIIVQKRKIIEQIEQSNKDVIREIGKLDIPTLATIIKSKFSQSEELTYKCPYCDFIGKNSRSLAAHKRSCIKIKNSETSET